MHGKRKTYSINDLNSLLFYLSISQANTLKEKGTLMELVDSRLEASLNKKEAMKAITVALRCTNTVATERPSMSGVVSMLEGTVGVEELVSERRSVPSEKMREHEEEGGQSISMDVPWTASSAATSDLYPLNVDTEYWEKRDLI